MDDSLVGYFGYGSLVNRETLRTGIVEHVPAILHGWRRHWQARPAEHDPSAGEAIALLSVHRHASTSIHGALVIDHEARLPQVDAREAHYDRVPVALSDIDQNHLSRLPKRLYVYVARCEPQCQNLPALLQSYLDAVMAGFENLHGEGALRRFLATTTGFERRIIADRLAPKYPRAVQLDPQTARRYDLMLAEIGVCFSHGRG